MEPQYLPIIATQCAVTLKQVNNVFGLQAEGATIPFMARYRKEATGNLDEVAINAIVESIKYFEDLEKRKETVRKTIDGLGKLDDALKQRINDCTDAAILEDIYLPYKPKRKTRASQAIEKGLEPLAQWLFQQNAGDPGSQAAAFLNDQVKDSAEALQGARDIIAEWVAENNEARALVRKEFQEHSQLVARVLTTKKEDPEAQKYRDYFEFSERLADCPSHRILAIRRGEKEGYLLMDINIDKDNSLRALEPLFIKSGNAAAAEVKTAMADGFDRLLKPAIETEFRMSSKQQADEEAIRIFAENLRQLLLASPLGSKRVLALDPGFRTGCKLVCLDAQGNLFYNTAIYPHPPQQETGKSIQTLKELVKKYDIEAIGIGNGTAGRETESLVRGIDFGKPVSVFQVNESGASIYSASEVAREEFPDHDITVRGAVSIGRRLLDPLSELVKIDAKSIGVGQYQHDVNQTRLKESLDRVVESCVNHVGVDVNTASKHLLNYVSGLSSTLAKNIVDYRQEHGPFATRAALKKVPLMGPKSFEQCAGFLRIPAAKDPLDNSAVHPESYHIVASMAKQLGCTVTDLVNDASLRKQVKPKDYISETIGAFTIQDILQELEKPGRDPRGPIEVFQFDDTVKTMEDLKPGMQLPGIVTNITQFGVFVDIGVKQDGLVHVSQLSNTYVSDPATVVKLQQKVKVTVTEVDVARKRIGLSMKEGQKEGGAAAQKKFGGGGGRPAPGARPGAPGAKTPGPNAAAPQKEASFEDKLKALKKRFG